MGLVIVMHLKRVIKVLSGLYADGVIGSGDFQGNKVYGTCRIFIVITDSAFLVCRRDEG